MKLKEQVARAICDIAKTGQGNWPVYRKDAQAAINVIADWLAQDDEYKHLAKQLRSE